ncbi:carboxymuconolactone decarboxylase family protein [Streptomyces sp. AD55]|uniref:carboxymuconolactone decarboxylase family protein n=1 Tax=Streptomyces sp. AD55 TaxID=3242895 RepID=UPI003529D0A7
MARVSLTPPRTLFFRAMEWYSRRTYGKVLDPGRALAHNPRVLRGDLRFERSVARWNRLDPGLKALAELAAAGTIGCSWCMDFGYWQSVAHGVDRARLQAVPVWRESELYSPLERDVLEYAEAMTATPPAVGDGLAARLRDRLGEPAFVELTAIVAVENLRSRLNSALGLTSQGFRDSCDLADAPPAARAGDA